MLIVRFYFSGDRSERERVCRGGEVYEYQEEGDQGQAIQGKPSNLVAYLIQVLLVAHLLLFIKCIYFYYCYYLSMAILLTQLRESIVIILRMTPFDTYQLPAVEG
jgi:hypothetical protein